MFDAICPDSKRAGRKVELHECMGMEQLSNESVVPVESNGVALQISFRNDFFKQIQGTGTITLGDLSDILINAIQSFIQVECDDNFKCICNTTCPVHCIELAPVQRDADDDNAYYEESYTATMITDNDQFSDLM